VIDRKKPETDRREEKEEEKERGIGSLLEAVS
jgi:hypothetical protein